MKWCGISDTVSPELPQNTLNTSKYPKYSPISSPTKNTLKTLKYPNFQDGLFAVRISSRTWFRYSGYIFYILFRKMLRDLYLTNFIALITRSGKEALWLMNSVFRCRISHQNVKEISFFSIPMSPGWIKWEIICHQVSLQTQKVRPFL